MPTKPPIEPNIRINRKVVKIVLITITIIAIAIFSGYPQFVLANIRCGQSPVMVEPGSSIAGGDGTSHYFLTEDEAFYKPSFSKKYYCTKEEAEKNRVEPSNFSNEGQRRLQNLRN